MFGYKYESEWDGKPRFLTLGPAAFALFRLRSGNLCFEIHWRNRLVKAMPDWRVVGL